MKSKNKYIFWVAIFGIFIFTTFLFHVFLFNNFAIFTYRGYFIPQESSVWSFKPKVWNNGSGEWWIYGMDENYFYYAGDGIKPNKYIKIEKNNSKSCENFDPENYKSWCNVK
jgi:hypothetical protein